MKIKAIVFDLDGTLFSSEDILLSAYQRAIEEFAGKNGKPLRTPPLSDILSHIGNPADKIFGNLFPSLTLEESRSLGKASRRFLVQSIRQGKGLLFPEVKETLKTLADYGFFLRIASNGNLDYIGSVLDHYKLTPHFGALIGLNGEDLKDKGDLLNLHKSLLDLSPSEMIMVGDRRNDYEASAKAGCPFIGVSYGHGRSDEIQNAYRIIHRFGELPSAVTHLEQETTEAQ